MLSYAGIGSRNINDEERDTIRKIANKLSTHFILYSGNATGSDISFQEGSNGNCVIMLPWYNFNSNEYNLNNALSVYIPQSEEANRSIYFYHPRANMLSRSAKNLMARNYFQIHGYENYSIVSFVVFCADVKRGEVQGGTGQAIRIANHMGIPTINIRENGWKEQLRSMYDTLTNK